MSTFKGTAKEFPQIQIDYFRRVKDEAPPLAFFLSHVHSDHLQGLESLKGIFIYCSPATREILLRLEKYYHRMNFAKGILESPKQTYRHLKSLLKTIPLETPTVIEIRPGYEIRVTLFDANHCVGAVMFLIQGQGKAILYTGDIRSEIWWVNSLVQNPVLLPYAQCGKALNCIYLDTTFASKMDRYREFPSKAEGLKELVKEVMKHPKDTIFYMEAWTFGYENVWIMLSTLLDSQVHLDRYRSGLYQSLANTTAGAPECHEAGQLCGFRLGNHLIKGCLTTNSGAKIHSCEKGTSCPTIESNPNVVRIVPIVTRLSSGAPIHEMGIGGGKGDLDQTHQLEVNDRAKLGALMQLCVSKIEDKDVLLKTITLLNSAPRIDLGLDLDARLEEDDIKLEELVAILSKIASEERQDSPTYEPGAMSGEDEAALPTTIMFPYSRHSSYSELCYLVDAFRPKDVYPCTVDVPNWTPEVSMRALFGPLCSSELFDHDVEMMELYEERIGAGRTSNDASQFQQQAQTPSAKTDTQQTAESDGPYSNLNFPPSEGERFFTPMNPPSSTSVAPPPPPPPPEITSDLLTSSKKRLRSSSLHRGVSPPPRRPRSIRQWAWMAATGMDTDCDTWDAFGGLSCVNSGLDKEEEL